MNSSWSFVLEPIKDYLSVEHNGMSHVIGIRHDSADEGIPWKNGMKVKWYRGRKNVSFVFTTESL